MTVTFIEVEGTGGVETHAILEHADGSYTSMLKSTYEALKAQQVEHLTEIPTN